MAASLQITEEEIERDVVELEQYGITACLSARCLSGKPFV